MRQKDLDLIPSFTCIPGCHDCCGPHPWTKQEHERIWRWLQERGRPMLFARSWKETCPYADERGCSIYDVRPFLCRLYGVVPRMRCPHGRGPEKMLAEDQEARLVELYYQEFREWREAKQ